MKDGYADLKRVLYTAVLSDILDALGMPDQAMRPFLRPIDEAQTLMGHARTGRFVEVTDDDGIDPYGLEIELIDDLASGDVPVLSCAGPTERIAPWGELLSTAAVARGAAGCVTDGLVRDVRQLRAMRFPVVHGGIGPLDTKGRARMVERDRPIRCGGVAVNPGDLVFGDVDGTIVIPADRAGEVIDRAVTKIAAEDTTREELRRGDRLAEVFARHGIL